MHRGARLAALVAGLAFAAAGTASPAPPPSPAGNPTGGAGEATAGPATLAAALPREVPYVSQGPRLCGGAALAMVRRYWGATHVYAEEFAGLVSRAEGGIRAGDLEAAGRSPGWRAEAFAGTLDLLREQLALGRPVVALIRVGGRRYHYVVVTALASGRIRYHDPAIGPDRERRDGEFLAAWRASGFWSLVVTPEPVAAGSVADSAGARGSGAPAPAGDGAAPASTATAPASGPCDSLIDAGVARAVDGAPGAADSLLTLATARCPASSRARRELAGLRFQARRWRDAAHLARESVALAPADTLGWQILAASLFLADDPAGALGAWNAVGTPRVDLVRIDGLRATRYPAVVRCLDLPPRTLLTPPRLSRAARRLAAFPAVGRAALRYRPDADGDAQVEAAVVERASDAGARSLLGLGCRAAGTGELRPELTSPTGDGERIEGAWRWERERPLLGLRARTPAPATLPGVVTVEGYGERETFLLNGDAGPRRRELARRRTSLAWSDWLSGSVRLGGSLAYDRWRDRGGTAAAGAALETRLAGDHLRGALTAEAWSGGFTAGSAGAGWSPTPFGRDFDLSLRASFEAASATAPLSLVPGAGVGRARPSLLRAHPLLRDGVLAGPAFGRRLACAGVEGTWWALRLPVRAGLAVFVDAARAGALPLGGSFPVGRVDAGLGLRLELPDGGTLRLDAAWGLSDRAHAISVTATPWRFS